MNKELDVIITGNNLNEIILNSTHEVQSTESEVYNLKKIAVITLAGLSLAGTVYLAYQNRKSLQNFVSRSFEFCANTCRSGAQRFVALITTPEPFVEATVQETVRKKLKELNFSETFSKTALQVMSSTAKAQTRFIFETNRGVAAAKPIPLSSTELKNIYFRLMRLEAEGKAVSPGLTDLKNTIYGMIIAEAMKANLTEAINASSLEEAWSLVEKDAKSLLSRL